MLVTQEVSAVGSQYGQDTLGRIGFCLTGLE